MHFCDINAFTIKKYFPYHLGIMNIMFEYDKVCEDDIKKRLNAYFSMDKRKYLGFIGDNEVKYEDVVSPGEPITMIVHITGSWRAQIQPSMIIFKNASLSYAVRLVADAVPGFYSQTSPNSWMNWKVWS